MSRGLLIALLLSATVLTVYGQSYKYEFVWDDNQHIVENEYYKPVTVKNLAEFWRHPYFGLYIPVTYSVWGIEAKLAEGLVADERGNALNPYVFHTTNIALHLLNVLVVFAILKRLIEKDWTACLGALLFALHPLQTETVAWISGTRDLLSALFSLLTIYLFLVEQSDQKSRSLQSRVLLNALATICFALAMLSKPSAIVVPAIAWLLATFKYRRPSPAMIWPIAWTLLCIPIIIVSKKVQGDAALLVPVALWQRPLVAADAIAFYLYKLFCPIALGIDYGRTPQRVFASPLVYLTAAVPIVLLGVLFAFRRRVGWLLAGALVFVLAVLPASGLVLFDFQIISTVADRYAYFAMLGAAIALAWALARWPRAIAYWSAVIVILALGARSALQTPVWENGMSLYTHALKLNPKSWVAHGNLGTEYMRIGDLDSAQREFQSAIDEYPRHYAAHEGLGKLLIRRSMTATSVEERRRLTRAALDSFAKALESAANIEIARSPRGLDMQIDRIMALAVGERYDEAQSAIAKIIEKNPNLARAYHARGYIAFRQKRFADSIVDFRKAIELNANFALAWKDAGRAFVAMKNSDVAIAYFERSLQIDPKDPEAHTQLGIQLALKGRKDEARKHFEEALRLNRDYTPADVELQKLRP